MRAWDEVGKPIRDREPVEVGQADVEDHDIGAEVANGGQCANPVGGTADHGQALALEKRTGLLTEGTVIVDDEIGCHDQDAPTLVVESLRGYPQIRYPGLPIHAPRCHHAPVTGAAVPRGTTPHATTERSGWRALRLAFFVLPLAVLLGIAAEISLVHAGLPADGVLSPRPAGPA
jgi:hypothetical protein